MRSDRRLGLVFIGRSLSSAHDSHAVIYRRLLDELGLRGHEVLFLEQRASDHRGASETAFGSFWTASYGSREELEQRWAVEIREADAVIVGSQVTEGARVLDWVLATARGAVAFYDLDTILTLRLLERGVCDYLRPDLVPRLDAYLSTTGGPLLARIRDDLGAERVRPLYAGADPKEWPDRLPPQWDLGFLGAYCEAREPSLDRLLLQPARWSPDRRFVVAGGLYPRELRWPDNVELLGSIPPAQHRALFGAQRFLLDVTRPWVSRSGYSPSLALLDAAMCATSVITDHWIGIERFFVPGREILVAYSSTDVLEYLELSDAQREEIGMLARERVLAEHTSAHRARELERHALEWLSAKRTHAVQVPELRRAVA